MGPNEISDYGTSSLSVAQGKGQAYTPLGCNASPGGYPMTRESNVGVYLERYANAFDELADILGFQSSPTIEQIVRAVRDRLAGVKDGDYAAYAKIQVALAGASLHGLPSDQPIEGVEWLLETARDAQEARENFDEVEPQLLPNEKEPSLTKLAEALALRAQTAAEEVETAKECLDGDELCLLPEIENPSLIKLVQAAREKILHPFTRPSRPTRQEEPTKEVPIIGLENRVLRHMGS